MGRIMVCCFDLSSRGGDVRVANALNVISLGIKVLSQ